MILVLSHGIRQDSNLINSHSTLSQVNDKICQWQIIDYIDTCM